MSKDNITNIENTEVDAVAETEAETVDASVYVHQFKRPFEYQGKKYDELTFDFGRLTGRDSLAIENELQAIGKMVLSPEFSGEFLIRMAARSCTESIGYDALELMPMGDYNRIRARARGFLLRSGS